MREIILIIQFLLFSVVSYAQSSTISSYVYDEDGMPLIGVSVFVMDGEKIEKGTTTDELGHFDIVIDLESEVHFSYIGYEDQVQIAEDLTNNSVVVMYPGAFVLESIVLSACYDHRGCVLQGYCRESKTSIIKNDIYKITQKSSQGNSKWKIYPTITTAISTIESKNSSDGQLLIFNLNGHLVGSQQLSGLRTEVDLSGLVSGGYFIRYVHDNVQETIGRVIKI